MPRGSVVERAWEECRREIWWARRHLQALEDAAAAIRRDRRVPSTGVATLDHMARAQAIVREVRRDLDGIEARLWLLAEGVDADAAVG